MVECQRLEKKNNNKKRSDFCLEKKKKKKNVLKINLHDQKKTTTPLKDGLNPISLMFYDFVDYKQITV